MLLILSGILFQTFVALYINSFWTNLVPAFKNVKISKNFKYDKRVLPTVS